MKNHYNLSCFHQKEIDKTSRISIFKKKTFHQFIRNSVLHSRFIFFFFLYLQFSVIRQKSKSSEFSIENSNFLKNEHLLPSLICTRTCAYQREYQVVQRVSYIKCSLWKSISYVTNRKYFHDLHESIFHDYHETVIS